MVNWNKILMSFFYAALFGGMMISVCAQAQSIDNIKIIKLLPSEGSAVIRLDTGEIETIGVGDRVMDIYQLSDLSEDRVVLDNIKSETGEKLIIRIENGEQRIERVTLLPEPTHRQYQIMKPRR